MLDKLHRCVEGFGGYDSGTAAGGAKEGEGKGKVGAVAEEEHDDVALADVDVVKVGDDATISMMDIDVGEGDVIVDFDEVWVVVEW